VGYFVLALVLVAGSFCALLCARYLRDLQAAQDLQRVDGGRVVQTRAGPIEYATYGEGPPVLLSHELLGGFNHGLLIARAQFGQGFQTIAVSRFGYLGTPLPNDSSPAAQADAYADLLDTLGIQRVAIAGTSSGGASAMQFALRHPDRTSALVLLSATGPGGTAPPPRPLMNVLFGSDFVFWAWQTYAGSTLLSAMGVPADFQAQQSDPFIRELMPRFLPLATAQRAHSTTCTSRTPSSRTSRSSASRCQRSSSVPWTTRSRPSTTPRPGRSGFPGCALSPWTGAVTSYSGNMSA
jgi:pimeloyl-ACP methyl ester carboxylesterase